MSQEGEEDRSHLIPERVDELARRLFIDNRFQQLFDVLRGSESTRQFVDVVSLVDKKGCSLLHYTILSFDINHVKFLVNYVQMEIAEGENSQMSSQNQMSELEEEQSPSAQRMTFNQWINWPNNDGFTAILYASFRGDCSMISLLVNLNANIHAKNSKGLNALHVAAQGDQPLSIRYFQQLGLSPLELEYKHSNPLHWASFLGNEHTINYLTAYTLIDLSSKDESGYTPLFLAVMSGSARAVKRLLQKGADKNQRDLNGNTPIQQAKELGYENIQQMLEEEGGVQEYFNLKQPFKPIDKSIKQVMLFFLLFGFIQGCFGAFYIPCMEDVEFYLYVGLSSFTLLMYLCSWLVNAGTASDVDSEESNTIRYNQKNKITHVDEVKRKKSEIVIQRNTQKIESSIHQDGSIFTQDHHHVSIINANLVGGRMTVDFPVVSESVIVESSGRGVKDIEKDQLIQLYSLVQAEDICVECKIVKPRRSKHCEVCKICVRVYDHHCPWINNCVGCGNLKYFIWFLLGLWLAMVDLIAMIVMHFEDEYTSTTFVHWFTDDEKYARYVKFAVGGIVGVVVLPFFLMLSALLFVQLKNIFLNLTTYERFNVKVNMGIVSSSKNEQQKSGLSDELLSKMGEESPETRRNRRKSLKKKKQKNEDSVYFSCWNVIRMCCTNKYQEELNYHRT